MVNDQSLVVIESNYVINSCRPFLWIGLSLFLFLTGCKEEAEKYTSIEVAWQEQEAVAVIVPNKYLTGFHEESLSVALTGAQDPMLGEWDFRKRFAVFTPIVPFSRGHEYVIFGREHQIAVFSVEAPEAANPIVLGIYPTSDSLPENLLKIYIEFSSPMREQVSSEMVKMINLDTGDTLEGTFLNLQPELWNDDNTLLSMWLDPGRIKRELIPNRALGAPLDQGRNYRLIIDSLWRSTAGEVLEQDYTKDFFTLERDESSPDIQSWSIEVPESGSKDAFRISFHEALDAVLIAETIRIATDGAEPIPCEKKVLPNETGLELVPVGSSWKIGKYRLEVESRLSDLAGNNLNHLFDQEISSEVRSEENYYFIPFEIR